MKSFLILISICLLTTPIFGQAWMQYLPAGKTESSLTFFDYQDAFKQWCIAKGIDNEGYFINSSGVRQKAYGWKQFKRWEYESISMGYFDLKTGARVETRAMNRALDALQHPEPETDNLSGNWINLGYDETIGPTGGYDGIGRLNTIAFHPTNPDIFWVGAPRGGIWVTYDGGDSWAPLSDNIAQIGVSAIAIPSDYDVSQTIYIGTGDRGHWDDMSIGILKSTDGGNTWQETSMTYDFLQHHYIGRLLIHPDNVQVQYAGTNWGLDYTTDGWVSHTNLSGDKIIDMEFHPTDPDTLYVSTRDMEGYSYVKRSTDGGNTWQTILVTDGGRTEIAVSPDEPDWIYAVVANDAGGLKGIYRSLQAGNSFNQVYDGSAFSHNLLCGDCSGLEDGGQGSYDLCIAVNPLNAMDVWIGGINMWRSIDGGESWDIISHWTNTCGGDAQVVHADHHWLEFQHNTETLFNCNDGGIYRLEYPPAAPFLFFDLTGGLTINQIYRLSNSQQDYDEIMLGLQDNSTVLWTDGDLERWGTGDGTDVLIHPDDDNIQYYTGYGGYPRGTLDHWGMFQFDFSASNDSSTSWFKCFRIDPSNPEVVYWGLTNLWKSTNFGIDFTLFYDPVEGGMIHDIAVADSDPDVIVFANYSNLYRTSDGGVNWTVLTSYLPVNTSPEYISDIEIKHDDPNVIWLTFAYWNQTTVLESINGGVNWENISDGLEEAPVIDIIQDDSHSTYPILYAAGFYGVYVKLGNQPWFSFNTGLPNLTVKELDIYYAGNKLRAGTWGRGFWESDLFSPEAGMQAIWTGIYNTDWNDYRNWLYMEVPGSGSDVLIPAGTQRNPHVYTGSAICHNLVLESGKSLNISDFTLVVLGDAELNGAVRMHNNNSKLTVQGNISWESGSSFELTGTNASFNIFGNWTFQPGSTVDLTGTEVKFSGADFSNLIVNSANCVFGKLIVDKSPPFSLLYAASSTENLIVKDDFSVTSSGKYYQESGRVLEVWGDLDVQGTFFQQHGTYRCIATSTLYMTPASYFDSLEIDAGFYVHALSDIEVRDLLYLKSGTFSIYDNTISLKGDLDRNTGTFLMDEGKISFQGSDLQWIWKDFYFKNMELNTTDTLLLKSDILVEVDSLDWNAGAVIMMQGATLTINELADNGIFGSYRLKVGATLNIYNPTGRLDLNAKLFINGGTVNVYGTGTSYWPDAANAELHLSSGTLDFHDVSIYVRDHPTYTFLDNITGGKIRTAGSFAGDHVSFNPAGGEIELYGSNNATLSHGAGSSFYKVLINKGTAADGAGTEPEAGHRSGFLKSTFNSISEENPKDEARYKKAKPPANTRANKVTLNSDLDIDFSIKIDAGELDINGFTVDIGQSLDITGKLTMTLASSIVNAGTSITWRSGSSSYILGGLITFKTIWAFQDGTSAMLAGTNTVKVLGNQPTIIQHQDSDARFNNLVIEKTGSLTTLDEVSTYPLLLNEDLIVKPGNTLRILNADVWLAGQFLAENTSTIMLTSGGSIDAGLMTIQNSMDISSGVLLEGETISVEGTLGLTDGGQVGFDDMNLSGTLDVNAGSVLLHNSFTQAAGGHLVLDGGSFIIDKPYSGTMFGFSGITDLNGGFFEITNDGIQFGTGATVNFNGGNLRIGGHFQATNANSFQPTAGAVEFINSIGSTITCANGNYFHSLVINKNSGGITCLLGNDVLIQNDLVLKTGDLQTMNNYVVVNGDLEIKASGKLTAGSSEISIGGNWNNERGTSGFAEGTSSVLFSSSQPATLTSETFYFLDIDKPLPSGQFLTMNDNTTLTVTNKLTLGDGVLLMGNNCTINANGDLHFKSGGGLNGNTAASGNAINVKGHWWDYNTLTTSDQGFVPGLTTVTFNGTANQDLLATGGVTFHHLTFQNPGNSVFIYDDVAVNGNFNLVSGNWYLAGTNLTHTFKGNFTVSDPALWMDAASILSFQGTNQQNLLSSTGGWLNVGSIEIDRPWTNSESGRLDILSDVSCANRMDVVSGEALLDGYRLMCQNALVVNAGGYLSLQNDVIVAMGNDASLHVDGGSLHISGQAGARPLFTRINTGYYEFYVENGGAVNASFADFEYINGRGLNIYATGSIGGSLPFNYCSFQKTEATGTLLQINNSQELSLHNVSFPANTWSGGSNIKKENNSGNVTMVNATGSYAGPLFENDVYSRIHWPASGIWEGDVSTEWHEAQNWRYNYEYPNGSTDVIIPAGVPNFPILTQTETYINSLTIAGNAYLRIYKDSLFVNTWVNNAGEITLGDQTGNITGLFADSIVWQPGSTASITDRGAFYITGNMFIRAGSGLSDLTGAWYFTGNDDSRLICHDTATINNLYNYKNAGYSLKLEGDTIARLTVNGLFRNGTGAVLECPSTQEWVFNGNFRNTDNGHIRCENGTITLRGSVTSTFFRVKPGDYFNNLTIESLTRLNLYTTTGYSDTLRVNGNLTINPRTGGTSGLTANNFKIQLMGFWINNAPATAFQAGTSRVIFQHPWDVQEVHGSNTFNYILTANDPDGHTRFYDNNTINELVVYFPAVAYGTLTVNTLNIDDTPSEMIMMEGSNVQVGTLIQGGKVISYGGSFTVSDLDQDYVTGYYTVQGGLVSLGQTYSPTATHDLNYANITITGGELRFTGGNGVSLWPRTPGVATVTMSDGVFDLTNQEVFIKSTGFTENISGGTIRTYWSFSADPATTTFHPTGGTVELYGTEDCSFSMPEPSCWFHNLHLSKTDGGGAYPSSNMRVKNEFRLKSGAYTETDGYLITVGP